METKWLRRALEDLRNIADFIEKENPKAARAFVNDVRNKTQRLASFPFMGRSTEMPDIRELVVHRHYLVSYRIRPGRIEILQIWHTARDRRMGA
jgi:toxin ParE1/3/4